MEEMGQAPFPAEAFLRAAEEMKGEGSSEKGQATLEE